jgi:hypothetical protein
MAYVEADAKDKITLIGLTQAKTLKKGDVDLVVSEDKLTDLGIQFSGSTLNLSTENGALLTAALRIHTDTEITVVTLNGVRIEFTYANNTVYINYTPKPEVIDIPEPRNPVGSKGGPGRETNPIAAVTVTPPEDTPEDMPSEEIFLDIADSWAKEEILKLYEEEVVTASEDKRFRPDDDVTRAEFASFLIRALKLPADGASESAFADVNGDDWFAGAVQSARRAGIINGYSDGTFRPNNLISREEMAKMLLAACDHLELPYGEADIAASYRDFSDISVWARDAVAAAADLQLMKGMENDRFVPFDNSTRAQAAVVINRLLGISED